MSVSASVITDSFLTRGRFVQSRQIEKPPQHGEKPYVQLVDDAFDGPTLKLSKRLRLLEEADTRKIRRGDALDAINSAQRRRHKQFAIKPTPAGKLFVARYAAFAAGYIALAAAWCTVYALT